MARPNFEQVFGVGSGYVPSGTTTIESGVFIPESALRPEGGFSGGSQVDAQQWFLMVTERAARQLNEANRNNDISGVVVTLTYGGYDSIIDPPGSKDEFRRDVFSVIAYQPRTYSNFNPELV